MTIRGRVVYSKDIEPGEVDRETVEIVRDLFLRAPKSLQMVTATMKFKDAYSLEESYEQRSV